MKRIFSILLVFIMMLSVLAGCSTKENGNETTTPGATTPEATTPEVTTPEVTTPD